MQEVQVWSLIREGAGGAKISHASRPKTQNIKQKQYCNRFSKDFKMIHIKRKKNLKKKINCNHGRIRQTRRKEEKRRRGWRTSKSVSGALFFLIIKIILCNRNKLRVWTECGTSPTFPWTLTKNHPPVDRSNRVFRKDSLMRYMCLTFCFNC